ncbi:hypothetical protein C2E21_8337 [Chlorella sorokiniana]|uniref:Uncharacterized protein n=1 Tax=Chlorella sorokiniana TaxID=3076 RepID=A0A2P6TF74_CHLSO|nr:hypothetical protein C2E21_8337 [Chlorella sorokiniana]|eukprot:PRW32622.1 hypothetical protein C2E21_8337 [Chlorella sorokiniana]
MRLALRQPCGPAATAQLARALQPPSPCSHCLRAGSWQQARPAARRTIARRRRRPAAGGGGGGDLHQPPPEDEPESSAIPDTLPLATADSDWRAFRAKLVASSKASVAAADEASDAEGASSAAAAGTADAPWAHSLLGPEQGCLLLASPLMFATSQQYFNMAVILIFAHDEKGSAGIILNRPTEYKVGDLGAGAASLQPELSPCTLYLGGDVGQESVHLLHGVRGLQQSAEVIPGVFLGGFEGAKQGLAEGRYKPEQFKVLTRYAGWGPGQLAAECRRGVWLSVSANKHAIFRTTLEGQLVADTTAFGRPDVSELWHYIAQLAGGDLAVLSRELA